MWKRMHWASAWLVVMVIALCVGSAEGSTISGLWIKLSGIGGTKTETDGGAGDVDGMADGQIHFPPSTTPPGSLICVNAIDPTKPIVTSSGTTSSFNLTLTNVEIVAKVDGASGLIQIGAMWNHAAFSGNLNVNVDGFATTGSTTDRHIISAGSSVSPPVLGPEASTVVDHSGTGAFSGSNSSPMVLPAGTHQVLFTMSFSLDKPGNTLFFPNSGDAFAAPFAVPAPGAGLAGVGLMSLVVGRRRRMN